MDHTCLDCPGLTYVPFNDTNWPTIAQNRCYILTHYVLHVEEKKTADYFLVRYPNTIYLQHIPFWELPSWNLGNYVL